VNPAAPESVHLANYPVVEVSKRDVMLEERMDLVTRAVTLARALRQERNLKVRQPLASMVWIVPGTSTEAELAPFLQIIGDELNVKEVHLRHDDRELVTLSVTANFKELGKRVGPRMRDVAAAIAQLSDQQTRDLLHGGTFQFEEFEFTQDDVVVRRTEKHGYALNSDGFMTVALDIELTPELEAEGMAREVVHHIQNLRKQEGLEITDRISVAVQTESAALKGALERFRDYISRETLARDVALRNGVAGTHLESNGHAYTVEIHRLSASPKDVIEA
jgi:isoleucyl-tRNA synthetase